MPKSESIEAAFLLARELYESLGVDVDRAMARLSEIPISIHCWQGDDVGGFEQRGSALGGGLAVTGRYPGKARTPDELRGDLEMALSLIPGTHRLNLHASYAETGGRRVERDAIEPEHFAGWVDWARAIGLGIDFNPTFFSHPMADDGYTLSHRDAGVRRFWIDHGIACRRVGESIGKALGKRCLTNLWIPDGSKEPPADRKGPRERLVGSLDEIFREPIDRNFQQDAVESKLFGLGSESYVVGSHEFYLGYALTRKIILCLDSGHFHPTETISDKISSILMSLDELLLHVSRGVRWDSDHVVTLSDDLESIAQEVVRGDYLSRVHFGLDYFDASINRVAAWVIGSRNLLKAILMALLEPVGLLREAENAGDDTSRLALTEAFRSLPMGAVWNHYCVIQGVPTDLQWLRESKRYEAEILSKRD